MWEFITSWKGMFLLFILGISCVFAVHCIKDHYKEKARKQREAILKSGAHPTIYRK